MGGEKKDYIMKIMGPEIEGRGFISLIELEEIMQKEFPDLIREDGSSKTTVQAYFNKTSHISNMQNPIYGEGSVSNVEIRKTMFKIGGKGHAGTGICHHSFDDKITTEEEYQNRTYDFTQEEWDQPMREKPGQFTDKKPKTAERVEEPGEESSGGSTDNEREKRYAEVLYRRKNIVLEGPPGTGKTYAIEGIVDELRSQGKYVGGGGEGKFAITMHPATSYEDFIEGLRPIGKGDFDYKPGVFVQRIKDAIQRPDQQHVVLLDELNRCNVPRVLGDLLTTLEASKRTESVFSESGDAFVECHFASATISKPIGGNTMGLRFSVPLMRKANSGDELLTYIRNPSEREIGETSKRLGEVRDIPKNDFGGDLGALHQIIADTNLHEIVFIFINGKAHPIISPEVVELILRGQPLGSVSEIQFLGINGVQTHPIGGWTFHDDSDYNSGKVSGTISINISVSLSGPNCECDDEDMESDYYWCESCDDKWDYDKRTEVSLSGSKKLLHVPNNLLVVATMNTTDRSVAPLDAALRRRFVFLRVDPLDEFPKKQKLALDGHRKIIFNQTESLWIELNDELRDKLGRDATIGHSYLFDLKQELIEAENDPKCDELVKQCWQYSVLPQVADLLDATGRSKSVWEKMKMEQKFKKLRLKLDTGPEEYKAFARTIIVETENEEESVKENQIEEEIEPLDPPQMGGLDLEKISSDE